MKENGGEIGKTEMSLFATKLHEGELITEIDEPPYIGKKVKISYNKRQFYDRILTPMKSMGIIDYNLQENIQALRFLPEGDDENRPAVVAGAEKAAIGYQEKAVIARLDVSLRIKLRILI